MRKEWVGIVLAGASIAVLAACPSVVSSDKLINSFGFLAADNAGLSTDYAGMIDAADITVSMPFYEDRTSLAASFVTTGALVQVGGIEQSSGVTVNDFSAPVDYVVVASDGTTATYCVNVARGESKTLSADIDKYDTFGISVAISGDYAVVGAEGQDDGGSAAGAAYVFHRTGASTWDAGTKLLANDASAIDNFGWSVGIDGDYTIVGAMLEDEGGTDAGAAYVFRRTAANSWDSGTKLVAFDAAASARFGASVAISGDYAIVGAPGADTQRGAAYVFHRTDINSWGSGVKLVGEDAEGGDTTGFSVAISGDYAIVGAVWEDSGGDDAGAAYVFHRTGPGNTWDAGSKLVAADAQASDNFGISVSIDGDYAIVGAHQEDAGGTDAGAVYVFRRTGPTAWDTGAKLVAGDAQAGDYFGRSVSLSGDHALVGAIWEDAGGDKAGAAYAFRRTGSAVWLPGAKIVATDAQGGANFGFSVSISTDWAIVGAPNESLGGGTEAGAAYIYY